MIRQADPGTKTNWAAVVALGLAVVIVAVDVTAVATGLPAMSATFDADPARAQWIFLAFSLPMIALILPAGRWVDDVNLRHAFLLGAIGFAVASALVGVAPTFEILLAGRALQGAFGALIGALFLAVAAEVVNPAQRGQAMGLITTVGPLGSIAGPALGGVIISTLGWPWIFYLNLPICAVAAYVGWRSIPSQGRLHGLRPGLLAEAVLAGGAALGLLLALNHAADRGQMGMESALLLIVGALALAGWLRLPSSVPVVDALRRPALTGQLVALLLFAASTGAVFFLVPFLLQNLLGRSPSEAGLVFLAIPAMMAVAAQLSGRITDRIGARPVLLAGLLLNLAGGLLLLPLDPSWGSLDVAWRLGLIGLGNGFIGPPNQSAILAASPAGLFGTVSALAGLGRNLGFALGPAVATLLWIGGALTPDSMRLAFSLLAVLPGLALATVLVTPSPRRTPAPSAAPGDSSPRAQLREQPAS